MNHSRQASLYISTSQGPPKPMSIESVMISNHLIFCHPLLLLPSIFPNVRVFTNESALCIRWPNYQSFSFSISPFNEFGSACSNFLLQHLSAYLATFFSWAQGRPEALESYCPQSSALPKTHGSQYFCSQLPPISVNNSEVCSVESPGRPRRLEFLLPH